MYIHGSDSHTGSWTLEIFLDLMSVVIEKQSCFDKIIIDLLTNLWLFVIVWC